MQTSEKLLRSLYLLLLCNSSLAMHHSIPYRFVDDDDSFVDGGEKRIALSQNVSDISKVKAEFRKRFLELTNKLEFKKLGLKQKVAACHDTKATDDYIEYLKNKCIIAQKEIEALQKAYDLYINLEKALNATIDIKRLRDAIDTIDTLLKV